MFRVEFIRFKDWQSEAEVIQTVNGDVREFDEAIELGWRRLMHTPDAVGFRVVQIATEGLRIVAHRFRRTAV